MEEAAVNVKKESDRRIEELKKQVAESQKALKLESKAKMKLVEENKSLEEFL